MKDDGERIRIARTRVGLSTRDLARLMNVNFQTVSRWELGQRDVRVSVLREIAEICNTTVSYLVGDEAYDEPFRRFTGEIPVRTLSAVRKAPSRRSYGSLALRSDAKDVCAQGEPSALQSCLQGLQQPAG